MRMTKNAKKLKTEDIKSMALNCSYIELNSSGEYILDFSSLISGEKRVLPFEIKLEYPSAEHGRSFSGYNKAFDKDIVSCESSFVGKVEDKNEEFLLTFDIEAKLGVLCSRCAEQTEFEVKQTVSFPLCGKKPERGTEEFECFKKGKINLTEIASEFLILELPSQFFCRKVCAGLCPECGANLNYGVCECENKEVDSRLRPLADFLMKMVNESKDSEEPTESSESSESTESFESDGTQYPDE